MLFVTCRGALEPPMRLYFKLTLPRRSSGIYFLTGSGLAIRYQRLLCLATRRSGFNTFHSYLEHAYAAWLLVLGVTNQTPSAARNNVLASLASKHTTAPKCSLHMLASHGSRNNSALECTLWYLYPLILVRTLGMDLGISSCLATSISGVTIKIVVIGCLDMPVR